MSRRREGLSFFVLLLLILSFFILFKTNMCTGGGPCSLSSKFPFFFSLWLLLLSLSRGSIYKRPIDGQGGSLIHLDSRESWNLCAAALLFTSNLATGVYLLPSRPLYICRATLCVRKGEKKVNNVHSWKDKKKKKGVSLFEQSHQWPNRSSYR